MARKLLLLSILTLTIATQSIAQSQNTVLVLIPTFFAGPGALGSMWNTQLTILNNSDNALTSIPYIYPCPIPEGCLGPIPAHASVSFTALPGFNVSTGFFYAVRSDELPQAVFSLRFFDQSQAAVDYGTEIPVVTAAAFRESELQFLDVPADPRFRITLRVYALPGVAPLVRVRAYEEPQQPFGAPQPPSALIGDREFALNPAAAGALIHGPSLVVNDALGIQSTNTDKRYRLTVQSATHGVPIWALVTVTNNQTQRVSAITPQ